MRAASRGDARQVLELLSEEADLDAKDVYGNTALNYAVGSNSVETVLALLSRGASVKVRNQAGFHALKTAAHARQPELLQLLANAGLLQAARDGDAVFVGECIKSGADVDVKTGDGWTALMIATIK